jgi:hypothetical protein
MRSEPSSQSVTVIVTVTRQQTHIFFKRDTVTDSNRSHKLQSRGQLPRLAVSLYHIIRLAAWLERSGPSAFCRFGRAFSPRAPPAALQKFDSKGAGSCAAKPRRAPHRPRAGRKKGDRDDARPVEKLEEDIGGLRERLQEFGATSASRGTSPTSSWFQAGPFQLETTPSGRD